MKITSETHCSAKKSETEKFTLFSRFLSRGTLSIVARNGRLQGQITTEGITKEILLKGLPAYLKQEELPLMAQLLVESYPKLQGEEVDIFPRGFGGMKRTELPEGEEESLSARMRKLSHVVEEHEGTLVEVEKQEEPVHVGKREPEERETLDLSGQDCKVVSKTLKKLKSSSTFECLNLSRCRDLKDKDLKKVTKMHALKEVDLSGVDVSARIIGKLLSANQSMERLIVKDNPQVQKEDLLKIFLRGGNLQYVNLAGCQQLRDKDVMQEKKKLEIALNVQETFSLVLPSGEEEKTWAEMETLKVPVFSVSDIDSMVEVVSRKMARSIVREGVKMLLKNDPKIKMMILVNTPIGNSGVVALAGALRKNQMLQFLGFQCQKVGDLGVLALAGALEKNQTIQGLSFMRNRIGDAGAQALAGVLEKHQVLQQLILTANQIGDVGAQVLAQALEENKSLQYLSLFSNQIGALGAQALIRALEKNSTLEVLWLRRNKIGNSGAEVLAQLLDRVLKKNDTLQQLDLSENQIGDSGKSALKEVKAQSRHLKHLAF